MKDKFKDKTGEEFDLSAIAIPHREELQEFIGKVIENEFKGKLIEVIRVLEIGCGTGYTTSIILDSDSRVKVTAVDNEPKMLKQARKQLSSFIAEKRVELIEADALEFIKKQKSESYDVFASALTLHNFNRDCRERIIKEIFRVLKVEGIFINADKYALDNKLKHEKSLDWQLDQFKNKFSKINRPDLIDEWINHYLEDEKPGIIMKEADSIALMKNCRFKDINIMFRKHMEAILVAKK